MTEDAIKGKFNGGKVTFGYQIDANKHFQADPATAPIVSDIFNRYANGETIISIVEALNNKRVTAFMFMKIKWLRFLITRTGKSA